jgi:hypothetical protein
LGPHFPHCGVRVQKRSLKKNALPVIGADRRQRQHGPPLHPNVATTWDARLVDFLVPDDRALGDIKALGEIERSKQSDVAVPRRLPHEPADTNEPPDRIMPTAKEAAHDWVRFDGRFDG